MPSLLCSSYVPYLYPYTRREAHAQWKEYAMFATGDVRILPPRVIAQRVCVFPSLPQTLRQLNLVGPLLPVCVGR